MSPPPCSRPWDESGAAWLTGRTDGPALGGFAGVEALVSQASEQLLSAVGRWPGCDGVPPPALAQLDAMALLGERAALQGLARRGDRSCGGGCRLLAARDGWIALSLSRDDDVALLPAWLESDAVMWSGREQVVDETLRDAVATRPAAVLAERATLLGLAVSVLGEAGHADGRARDTAPVVTLRHTPGPAPNRRPLVVDLSALWAGPLCAGLLADAGADVVKVESLGRPDGMRGDTSGLFDLLSSSKRSVAVDVATVEGRAALLRLVEAADIVVESSRPRALQQLGIDAERLVGRAHPTVWVSITAHGRQGESGRRVGFGDDAAVAGGLVAWTTQGDPLFAADAVADPLTGLVAAAAAAEAWSAGGSWLLDVALSRVAAHAAQGSARPSTPLPADAAMPPRARPVRGRAAPLGAHTAEVLSQLDAGQNGVGMRRTDNVASW